MTTRLLSRGLAAMLAVAAASAPGAARAAGGMPQFDFADPLTMSQVFWMAVIFLVLYLLVTYWGLPRVGEILETRRTRIATDLETAQAAKTSADAAMEDMNATTQRAHADAQAEIAAAVAAAKREAAERAEALNRRLDTELGEAEQRIGVARTAAMRALPEVASDTTRTLLAHLLGGGAQPAVEQAVAGALAARGQG